MYSTYLFDFDGCLVDSLEICMRYYREIYAHFGLELKDKVDTEKLLADINFMSQLEAQDPEFVARKDAECDAEITGTAQLNPGALELINTLKAEGKKLAIVSSSVRQPVEAVLKRVG